MAALITYALNLLKPRWNDRTLGYPCSNVFGEVEEVHGLCSLIFSSLGYKYG